VKCCRTVTLILHTLDVFCFQDPANRRSIAGIATISSGNRMEAKTRQKTSCCFIQNVIGKYIALSWKLCIPKIAFGRRNHFSRCFTVYNFISKLALSFDFTQQLRHQTILCLSQISPFLSSRPTRSSPDRLLCRSLVEVMESADLGD
jgi:hypothetical protein